MSPPWLVNQASKSADVASCSGRRSAALEFGAVRN
jgi:hypothetical protein